MTETASDPSPIADSALPLEVLQATKRYGEVVALDDVSLRVEGGIFGLLGANGAGKSTLMKAIVDLVPLDTGTIRVRGADSTRDLEARRITGYLPEELRLYDRLTFAEFLELVDGLRGPGGGAGERREWLEWFGLWPYRDLLVAEGSLGMRKKIGLAAALVGGPRLVILDEPLNGLDTESMRRLRL
ncbi:MAG: ABC transporter ATP-binding protein, partial [Acidobacteriota bacterium]